MSSQAEEVEIEALEDNEGAERAGQGDPQQAMGVHSLQKGASFRLDYGGKQL